jgi:hypothetical protein
MEQRGMRPDNQGGDDGAPTWETRGEGADEVGSVTLAVPEASGDHAGVVDAWFFLGW